MTFSFFGISLLTFLLSDIASGLENMTSNKENSYQAKIEISVGQTISSISESHLNNVWQKYGAVIPTTSTTFLFENLEYESKWSLLYVINIPTSSQKFIFEGEEKVEKANPGFLLGPKYKFYQSKFNQNTIVDLEVSGLAGFSLKNDYNLTPFAVLATRINLISYDGSTFYVGASNTFGLEAQSIFYGIGHRH